MASNRNTQIKLLASEVRNVTFAIGEATIAGVVIGGIMSDSPSRFSTIVIGILVALGAFAFSYFIKNYINNLNE